jgi:hypothetical protein
MVMTRLIQLGAILHFGILIASALVPVTMNWRAELAKLPALLRHLIWVHGAFIVLTIIGFGTLSLVFAESLADGSRLSRGVAGFISVFWLARLALQVFVLDAKPYLKRPAILVGYHGLTAVFTALVLVYGYAALR